MFSDIWACGADFSNIMIFVNSVEPANVRPNSAPNQTALSSSWVASILYECLQDFVHKNCYVHVYNFTDFNLSGGCFGTDIIQKCTKWSQIGVHGLKICQIFAKFQCASFPIRKNVKKWKYGRKKRKTVVFRETKSLRSYTGHTKVGKKQFIR